MGNRVKDKPKRKGKKSSATNLNSKRRAQRLGKVRKRGLAGSSANYISRTRAVKKLQITLRDFRRLCILKGIYPRDPKKTPNGKSKTYYHIKDIMYLSHEPLLVKFREFKSFMNKVRKKLNRAQHKDANRMYERRPEYALDRLVMERYPRFTDALADMDDALTLVHLFASLPTEGSIRVNRVDRCIQLCREWQNYVVRSNSLRKVFFTIKGVYFQAEVQGQSITWVVPHRFSQDLPRDVDYRTMLTFLEFYENFLGFVNFKLYHGMGLAYPPRLDLEKDQEGAHLDALTLESAPNSSSTSSLEDKKVESKDEMDMDEAKGGDEAKTDNKDAKQVSNKMKKRIKTLDKVYQKGGDDGDDEEAEELENGGNEDGDDEDPFVQDESVLQIKEAAKHAENLRHLFKGMRFYLSREVPLMVLEFCIKSFGGSFTIDPNDAKITHHVTDRPNVKFDNTSREYIQPQWVFDCANAKFILPVTRYAPNSKDLPPHLSPFVDDAAEGYTPDYAKEVDELREKSKSAFAIRGVTEPPKELVDAKDSKTEKTEEEDEEEEDGASGDEDSGDDEGEDEDEDEEEDEEEEDEEDEDKYVTELKEERASKRAKTSASVAEEKEEKQSKEPEFIPSKRFKGPRKGYLFKRHRLGTGYYKDAPRKVTFVRGKGSHMSKRQQRKAQKKEDHKMREMMMSKKNKRLYGRMQHGIKKKQDHVDNLKRKRDENAGSSKGKRRSKRNVKN